MAERTHMLQILLYKCELLVESGKKCSILLLIFVNFFSEPKLISSTHTDQMAERTHMLQVLPYKCELFVETGKKMFYTVADFCKYFFRAKMSPFKNLCVHTSFIAVDLVSLTYLLSD